ncbi:MAG: hypothetical protein V4857_19050 [Pseudomonadota bacterium]
MWTALIYAAAHVVGFASGLSLAYWQIYGDTFEVAIANARVVRRLVSVIVSSVLFWRLAAPVQQRFLYVVAVFVTFQLIELAESFFNYDTPVADLLDGWGLARRLMAAAIGLGLASWSAKNSNK